MSEDVREAFERVVRLTHGLEGPWLRECNDVDPQRTYEKFETQEAWEVMQAATASTDVEWRGLVEKLVEMAGQAADDLESEINENYNGTLGYPVQKRRYDNDMSTVLCLRDVLTEAAQMLGGKHEPR